MGLGTAWYRRVGADSDLRRYSAFGAAAGAGSGALTTGFAEDDRRSGLAGVGTLGTRTARSRSRKDMYYPIIAAGSATVTGLAPYRMGKQAERWGEQPRTAPGPKVGRRGTGRE